MKVSEVFEIEIFRYYPENGKEPYLSMGAEDFSYFSNEIPEFLF